MVGGYNLWGRGGCGKKPGEPACFLRRMAPLPYSWRHLVALAGTARSQLTAAVCSCQGQSACSHSIITRI